MGDAVGVSADHIIHEARVRAFLRFDTSAAQFSAQSDMLICTGTRHTCDP